MPHYVQPRSVWAGPGASKVPSPSDPASPKAAPPALPWSPALAHVPFRSAIARPQKRLASSPLTVNALRSARFYAILDTGYVPRERWISTCRALLLGGADIVQLRAKRQTPAERRALLEEILPLFSAGAVVAAPPPLIVNDDLALALAYPNLGLHVGQDDLAPVLARERLGPGRLLGLSTHSPEQVRTALALPHGTLDYFAVGPVFATPTKPDYTPVGLDLVRHVTATQPALPWFCIGGIKCANLAEVRAAGGSRVVVVSEVLCAADPAELIRHYRTSL